MTRLTRAQRVALKKVYDRGPILPWISRYERYLYERGELAVTPISYRQFRRGVQPGPDCVMIQWAGMWLGIEPDGYTHS